MTGGDTAAERIAAAMEEAGLSQRGLARKLAEHDGNIESWRRAISRWLKDSEPDPKNAAALADVLGGDPGYYRPSAAAGRRPSATVTKLEERMTSLEAHVDQLEAALAALRAALLDPPASQGDDS